MPRKTQLQITIPEPCHQSWQTMLPDGQGRFCNHCQKTVVDFVGMTDAEIVRLMSQNDRPTCGRFGRTQLNRPIVTYLGGPERSWPRLAVGAVLLMMAMPHALLAQAPNVPKLEIIPSSVSNADSPKQASTIQDSSGFMLRGHLIDAESGEPIGFAAVQISALGIGALSGEDGSFELSIPLERMADTLLLVARSAPEYDAEIVLHKNDLPSEITIAMQSNSTSNTSTISVTVGAIMVSRPIIVSDSRNEDPEPLFGPRKNKRTSK